MIKLILKKIINIINFYYEHGDWGLGIAPNPQSPIPNPQSPIPNPHLRYYFLDNISKIKYLN